MKTLITLLVIAVFCNLQALAQTQERGAMQEIKVIYKFPAKGSEDAKTNTLQQATLNEKKVNLLLLDSNKITISLQNGKKFIFEEVDENGVTASSGTSTISTGHNGESTTLQPAENGVYSSGDGTSGVFRLPRIESNVVVKDVFMGLQLFKKGMILTDESGKKKFFKLSNADSFDEADALFGK
jgi:hypothetical protein